MSIGADIGNELGPIDKPAGGPARFSSNAVPYILSTADALVILLSSIVGGIGYQLSAGYDMPSVLPYCAVGLLASFIHILRMSGSGYYDFPDSAKPRVEIAEILVCWFTTGLLLAFFAFLLKVGVDIRARLRGVLFRCAGGTAGRPERRQAGAGRQVPFRAA